MAARRSGTAHDFVLPEGACDTQVRLTGPLALFPAETDEVAPEATLDQLEARLATLGLGRAVLVQPAQFGTDNACMLQALAKHRNILRGVAAIGPECGDDTLESMAHTGVRGARLDARRVAGIDAARIEALARRIEPFRWHLQLAIDPPALKRLAPFLAGLPVETVIEDLGLASVADGLTGAGFKALLRLVRGGRAWVKLAGAARISAMAPPWPDLVPFVGAVVEADPTRLLWGSGWPHEPVRSRPPADGDVIELLRLAAPDERLRRLILVENPARLYRFGE